ncbi:alpha/beta fold hydrolase [Leucobacter chromiisoli]|uniref:alpha/beta fold hydrolase n=1 Tax=Leucobacter chromiisoli TaxID=2796471 RepID=UPI0027DCBFE5|nr:alpha/beta hydrolase [Leucobacter chromiisoli]
MSDASPDLLVPTLGIRTRAWQYGDPAGEPLILVHGFRGDHHGLEGLAGLLAETAPELRVVVPDLPGFGRTPAIPGREHDLRLYGEWLRAFVAEIAPGGFGILGHSFGSLVVARAIADGLDPSRIMLINPISSPALEGPNGAMTRLAIAYYRAAAVLPESRARRLLGDPLIVRVMSEVMAKTRDPELRSWIHRQHAEHFSDFSDSATLLQAFRASVSHTVGEFAAAFAAPTLLIVGDRDDITPLPEQLRLQRAIRGSRLRIVPGVGHLVHYEAVEDATVFVAGFLRETAAERAEPDARRGAAVDAGESGR